jgi:predicted DNA-binding protein (UPF0251 family)
MDHDTIVITLEEFEAIRLGDWLGLYHDECARQMGISRQTFGNIITVARHKIAGAIVQGKALAIDGNKLPCQEKPLCTKCGKTAHLCCQKETSCNLTCCGKRQKKCCKKLIEDNKGELQ